MVLSTKPGEITDTIIKFDTKSKAFVTKCDKEAFLSPILFTIYLDDLLINLSNLGVGCFWDAMFAGAFCYVDDLVLLAPSPSALGIMLQCCESFALERGLCFNVSKTQLIRFSFSLSCVC